MLKRFIYLLFTFILIPFAHAQLTRDQLREVPELLSESAIVMDATTGTLLYFKNPDTEIPPASLTKLMTMHIALREVKAGNVSLYSDIFPPEESWSMNQPLRSSLMFLGEGQRTNLHELLLGLAVSSGNDAAVAVALQFAPSVNDFAAMMTREAHMLGLTRTRFVEPSGISELNMTTAREFAQFCRFYINTHPETLQNYHSVREFGYPRVENILDGSRPVSILPTGQRVSGTIVPRNNNRLLFNTYGVDGLKTGFIEESGYNIALTAQRRDTRFIVVILGAPRQNGVQIREEEGKRLINWAFAHYRTIKPQLISQLTARVWKGRDNYINLKPAESLYFTSFSDRGHHLSSRLELVDPLVAPLPSGSYAGDLVFYDPQGDLYRVPVVTIEELHKGNFFKRFWDSIRLFFRRS